MSDRGRPIVAHVIASSFYGGPEKQIINHLKRLNGKNYQGLVVSFLEKNSNNEVLDQAKKARIDCHGVRMASPLDWRAWRSLRQLIGEKAVDILCVHGYKSTVMGFWIHKTTKIPTLAFSRGYTSESAKVRFYELLERFALRSVNGVVFVSEGQRKKLEALGVRAKRSWVIHNAVYVPRELPNPEDDRLRVTKRFGFSGDVFLSVSAGRLSPEKGFADLLKAMCRLCPGCERIRLLVCGDGPERSRLEVETKCLGLSSTVQFAGFRRDIAQVFSAMDLLILPSRAEGLPNVILEAFAYGKPVVATGVGGIPELVENEKNGFLVPPANPDLLAKAIARCVGSPDMLHAMGTAGREKVIAEFTFEQQNTKLQAIYDCLLAGRN